MINKLNKILKIKVKNDNKKTIENLVVFLILLIVTIITINVIWKDDKKEDIEETNTSYKQLAKVESNNNENTEYNLEEKLEDILSKIVGVGKVDVLITYSETSKVVAMYNENYTTNKTEEADTNGGSRKIDQTDVNKEVIYQEENGEKIPITEKVVMPKIEGAVVIAEGGSKANVKVNIIEAVAAVTGLSTYKIQVFEMKG